MFKQSLIAVSIFSLLLTGCSSDGDYQYKREAEGNENHLQTYELKPLIVPQGMTVPGETNEYFIYHAARDGAVGKELDIRPPDLPLPTIDDAYASYYNGAVTFEGPTNTSFWEQMPSLLSRNNITIASRDDSTIKTATRLVQPADEQQPVSANYLISRKIQNGRDFITIELTSLTKMGQDLTNPIESQRYAVELFNTLMRDFSGVKIADSN